MLRMNHIVPSKGVNPQHGNLGNKFISGHTKYNNNISEFSFRCL